jgi:uncharacterized membrane protein
LLAVNWSDITWSLNPTWPEWLPEAAALPTFLGAAATLALLTFCTYFGVRGAHWQRILTVMVLRLLALAIALLVAVRPSFGVLTVEGLEPSKIVILVDASESMNLTDDFNNQSRWDAARNIARSREIVDALKRLAADEQIEVVFYQAAEGLAPFVDTGPAQGKRTDIGAWLNEAHQKHAGRDKLRALLMFSDGADNGTRFSTLDEAKKWNGVCPIYTFGHGKPQQDSERKDIVVASVKATSPVPIKTKFTITGLVQAPGFKDFVVEVELWAQGPGDKEPKLLGDVEKHALKDEKNNEIVVVRDAPETPGEYKLTLKIKPVEGEADVTNNEASTYVLVTKEGVSVLWVEGRKRPYEPVFAMRYALAGDKRFRVFYTEASSQGPRGRDFYEFEKRQYDVIVIGDLSAKQFAGDDEHVLEKIRDLVTEKKVGLMMLGGVDTFGKGGWNKTPLAELLPVTLDTDQQLDNPVRFKPAEALLKLPNPNPYPFLILDDDDQKNRAIWDKKFSALPGMAFLGKVRDKERATVLAYGNGEEPLCVAWQPGGRVLVFAGDSTWSAWRRPQTIAAYNRFWRQLVLWVANQDDRAGNLWIDLKTRRLNANSADRLDFTFGLKGKTNLEVADAQFTVKAFGPKGEIINVPKSLPEKKHQRGSLAAPAIAGEYRLEIKGVGKDADGSALSDMQIARFTVVAENLELQRKAPDHELLKEIAATSGGSFDTAGVNELLKRLAELKGQVRREGHAKTIRWPDWDRRPTTDTVPDQLAGLWGSAALLWFFAFAALLSGEWGLRRMWGMV